MPAAPPILLFRAVPVVNSAGVTVQKGHLEFCGAAIIERLEMVVQREPKQSRTFPNLVVDLVVVDLSDHDDALNWQWIDDRRSPVLDNDAALRDAPAAGPGG